MGAPLERSEIVRGIRPGGEGDGPLIATAAALRAAARGRRCVDRRGARE